MDALLERLRRRDPAAFQEALHRHGGPLQRALEHLLHDHAAAEDLSQEAFARLFMNIDSVRSLRAWLFRVALNLARSHLRRRRVEERIERVERAPIAADGALREAIEAAIQELPEATRAAFVLREVAGLTTDEVAQAEECSAEAVRQRLVEARRRLRDTLGPLLRSPDFQGV
ncbi:MAG: RNA polymerase sigma factor [Planctomycetes bacterium]|nr:RNA polymerase sigma factor [Planctomycetota bacterium]